MAGWIIRRKALLFTGIVIAGVGVTSAAHGFVTPPIRIPPAVAGETEVDPPPVIVPPPTTQTPEPGTLALAAVGGVALAAWRRRQAAK